MGGTRLRIHVRNGPCPEKADGVGWRVARAGSAGLELELAERAETPREVAEGGRPEGNRARDFTC